MTFVLVFPIIHNLGGSTRERTVFGNIVRRFSESGNLANLLSPGDQKRDMNC